MRAFATISVLVLAFALVALGCDSDGGNGNGGQDTVTGDTGGPGTDAQGEPDVPITGDDVPVTGDDVPVTGDDVPVTGDDVPVTTDVVTPPPGCESAADLAILNNEEISPTGVAKDCALGPCAGNDDLVCLAECIANGDAEASITGTGLSLGCAGCYGGSTACGIEHCVLAGGAVCLTDAASDACAQCLVAAGCVTAFCECAGPTTPACVPPPPTDQCTNAADLAVLGNAEVTPTVTARECALGPCGGAEDLECLAECIATGNEDAAIEGTGLSLGCAGCYGGSTACGITNCVLAGGAVCLTDAGSQACIDCLAAAGCVETFCACAGEEASTSCTPVTAK